MKKGTESAMELRLFVRRAYFLYHILYHILYRILYHILCHRQRQMKKGTKLLTF